MKYCENIFSYGGGVQSFAILLGIKNGLVKRPEVIAHADMFPYEPKTRHHIETIARPIASTIGVPWITLDGSGLRKKLHEGVTMTPYWHERGLHAQRLCTMPLTN